MGQDRLKVLVVDDEEGIVDFMQKILRARGFDAVGAADGQAAVDLYDKEHPQIALIDIQLGYSRLTGLDVLEHIRKSSPETLCFMITRITDEAAVQKARDLGAIHYLLKPLDTREWLAAVQDAAQTIKARG